MSDRDVAGVISIMLLFMAAAGFIGLCVGASMEKRITPTQYFECDDGCGEHGLKAIDVAQEGLTCYCKDGFEKTLFKADIKESK